MAKRSPQTPKKALSENQPIWIALLSLLGVALTAALSNYAGIFSVIKSDPRSYTAIFKGELAYAILDNSEYNIDPRASTIIINFNGETKGTFKLNEGWPEFSMSLPEGRHVIDFLLHLDTTAGDLNERCVASFDLSRNATYRPSIALMGSSRGNPMVRHCKLFDVNQPFTPSTPAEKLEHKCNIEAGIETNKPILSDQLKTKQKCVLLALQQPMY